MVAILELGPVFLMVIPVFYFCLKRFKTNDLRFTGMSLAGAIVIHTVGNSVDIARSRYFKNDRDGIILLMILGFPLTVLIWKNAVDW